MKLSILLALALPVFAFADSSTTRILKDTETVIAIDLNPTTVFCTHRGYGSNQLKISVPDLDVLAHFNHRVAGETQPCMTAGNCVGDLVPSAFIDLKDPISLAPIRVVLSQDLTISDDGKTCTSTLYEHVSGMVKGHPFQHDHWGEPEPMDVVKCRKLVQAQTGPQAC